MEPFTMMALATLAGKVGGALGGLFGGNKEPYIPPELQQDLRFDQDINRQISSLIGGLNNPLQNPLAARLIESARKSTGERFNTLRTKQNLGLGRKYLKGSSFDIERESSLRTSEGKAFADIPINVGTSIQQNLLQQLAALTGARTGAGRTVAGLRIAGRERNDASRAALFEQLGSMFGGAATGGLFGGGQGALMGGISPDSAGLRPFINQNVSTAALAQ